MNYIMRPVFNRPEMLYLSFEYEYKARETHKFSSDLTTLFIVEYGAPKSVVNMLNKYPYNYEIIFREYRYGLSANILEGFKTAFDKSNDFVIYIEDDVLLHSSYFQFMDAVLNHPEAKDFTVASAYYFNDNGSVNNLIRRNHYAALAPLISKRFYNNYILPISSMTYYKDPHGFVVALDGKYKDSDTYRYKSPMHNMQAGVINRLTDVATIEEGLTMVMPEVNRQQHIGFYGHNRPGGEIIGNSFEERLENLRDIITDPKKLYEATGSKQYNDYKIFSPKLETWDGTLQLKKRKGDNSLMIDK